MLHPPLPAFLASVRDGAPVQVTITGAVDVARLIRALYESSRLDGAEVPFASHSQTVRA